MLCSVPCGTTAPPPIWAGGSIGDVPFDPSTAETVTFCEEVDGDGGDGGDIWRPKAAESGKTRVLEFESADRQLDDK